MVSPALAQTHKERKLSPPWPSCLQSLLDLGITDSIPCATVSRATLRRSLYSVSTPRPFSWPISPSAVGYRQSHARSVQQTSSGDFCTLGHYSPIPATNEASKSLPHRPVCRDPFCRCNRYRRHDLIVVTTFEMPNHLVMGRRLSAYQTAKLFVTNLGLRQIPSLFSSRDCEFPGPRLHFASTA